MYCLTCSLSALQIYNLLATEPSSVQLLDVRPFENGIDSIEDSLFIEMSQLPAALDNKKSQTLFVLIDKNGNQKKLFTELSKIHHPNVVYLEGGIESWRAQELPLTKVKDKTNKASKDEVK